MFRELLSVRFDLSPQQLDTLEIHFDLMVRWNRVLNLTRIDSREEAIERHYGESLFLAEHLPPGSFRVADVGSGAGFPGFPLAVARPECSVTLIESHQRKAVFLREVSRSLPNVKVLAKRAEEVIESFDWTVSRAVSYEDLRPVLKGMAPRCGLLTGAEEPPEYLGLRWEPGIALPSGGQRYLRIGSVSREIGCFT